MPTVAEKANSLAELKALSLASFVGDWDNLKPDLLALLGPMGRMAAGGLSLSPIASDGTKKALGRWRDYMRRRPSPIEVATWARRGNGFAIVCGVASGGLEAVDFDAPELYIPWYRQCYEIIERYQLPLVASPKGYHIYLRCAEIQGSTKLAKSEDGATLIETKGQGGYIIAPGNPRAIHPLGKLYLQMGGVELPTVPTITPDERRHLLRAAITFDKFGLRQKAVDDRAKNLRAEQWRASHSHHDSGFRVGDAFKAKATWPDVLEPHRWTYAGATFWTRPDGDRGSHSASVNTTKDGTSVLTVFSSNAGPLAPSTGDKATWDLFAAYAALNHSGDRRAAARELTKQGYGE